MANTITIQNSISWAQAFGGFKALDVGAASQPAITSANIIIQMLTNSPFCWNWNRDSLSFSTIAEQQDYEQSAETFGFVEKASYSTISGAIFEIANDKEVLGSGGEYGAPDSFAAQLDDNAGNITFRLLPVPDAVYGVTIIFQKKPELVTDTSDTWSPLPDHYSYIYQIGFLALMMAYLGDSRWAIFNQKFIASVLAAAEGLSEQDKNIFLMSWQDTMDTAQFAGLKSQQGIQGRGI